MRHFANPAEQRLLDGRGILQPGRPAFWLMVAVLVVGAGMGIPSMASIIAGNPISAGVAFMLLAGFGAVVFAVLATLEYLDPKPLSILAGAFALGALVATAFSQIVSIPLPHIFSTMTSSEAISRALAAATGEEIYKSLAVVVIFLVAPWWWNRVVDGLVIGAVVGLGFQLWEDLVYLVTGAGGAAPDFQETLTIYFDRVVLHGFTAHLAYTAIFGAALAYAVAMKSSAVVRIGVAIGGFALAWLVHFAWDAPFLGNLASNQGGLVMYSLIKAAPTIIVIVLIARSAYRHLRGDFVDAAEPEIGAGVLTSSEVDIVATWSDRRRARNSARRDGGRRASDAVAEHHRHERDLVRLHMHHLADDASLAAQRDLVIAATARTTIGDGSP